MPGVWVEYSVENSTASIVDDETHSNFITGSLLTIMLVILLQDHKKKCEKEGKYMEARTAAKRLHDLKVFRACVSRMK